MKNTFIILLACFLSFQFSNAQGITTHQYRKVAPENMGEYLKRETTYWAKFAESEVTKGNLTFWAILEKVGGVNQGNSPNILIINTVNNVDEALNWGSVDDMFPDVKMEDIQTNTISTNTAMIFLQGLNNHISAPGTVPADDFNYVKIVYHNPKNTQLLLDFEANKWKPMVQKAMEDGKTTLKGWGNARILHPSSGKFQYSTQSYDLFSSMNDALLTYFSDDADIPEDFFADLDGNDASPRSISLYRVVKVVSAPSDME